MQRGIVVERSPFAGKLFSGTNIGRRNGRRRTIDVVFLAGHGRIFIPRDEGLARTMKSLQCRCGQHLSFFKLLRPVNSPVASSTIAWRTDFKQPAKACQRMSNHGADLSERVARSGGEHAVGLLRPDYNLWQICLFVSCYRPRSRSWSGNCRNNLPQTLHPENHDRCRKSTALRTIYIRQHSRGCVNPIQKHESISTRLIFCKTNPKSVKAQSLKGSRPIRVSHPGKIDLRILQQHQRLQHIFHVVGHMAKGCVSFVSSSFLGEPNQDPHKG